MTPPRIVVIPNGIDVDQAPPPIDIRGLLALPPGVRLVGSVARLVPQKAPEVFVRACVAVGRAHQDVHFVLVGDGPLASEVRRLVASSAVADRFHLVSELEGAAGMLDQLDVFVLSSRFEGAPYAPMEAMRAATPVVLTDVVGSRDLVVDGMNGRLVPPDDPAALGSAIVDLLGDENRARSIGTAGREHLARNHDLGVTGKMLSDLYRRISSEVRP